MPVEFHFHCVWVIDRQRFVITVERNQQFPLTPDEFKTMLDDAEGQLAQQGTGLSDITLRLPKGVKIQFTGIGFKNVYDYLKRVYDGWYRFTFANDGQNKGKTHE